MLWPGIAFRRFACWVVNYGLDLFHGVGGSRTPSPEFGSVAAQIDVLAIWGPMGLRNPAFAGGQRQRGCHLAGFEIPYLYVPVVLLFVLNPSIRAGYYLVAY